MPQNREFDFLLAAVRRFLSFENGPPAVDGKSASPDLEWNTVMKMALYHGVLPALHQAAGRPEAPLPLDADARQLIDSLFLRQVRHNLMLTSELAKVMRLLESQTIPALPFKGPILASQFYGDLSLRPFSDIDLFVRSNDMDRAGRILASHGYRLNLKVDSPGKLAFLQAPLRSTWEYKMGKEPGINLELHSILPNRHVAMIPDFEALWEASREIDFAGMKMRNIPPDLLLILLSEHGLRHCWSRLMWICDISMLLRAAGDMDWDRLFERAQMYGSRRSVLVAVLLASRTLGVQLPKAALRQIERDESVVGLTEWVRLRIPTFHLAENSGSYLHEIMFRISVREGLRYRLPGYIHLARLALSPTEKEERLIHLPRGLHFLYGAIIRPLRLALRSASFLFSR